MMRNIVLILVFILISDKTGIARAEHKITANDAATGDRFGSSVSISRDYALVGAWGDDDEGDESDSATIYTLPTLSIMPTSLDFGSSGTKLPFSITNEVVETLTWTVSAGLGWVTVDSNSGSTTTETDTTVVTVNRPGLNPGSHSGTITARSNGGEERVTVKLAAPELTVRPTSLDFQTNTTSLTFNILNTGDGVLEWFVIDDQDWITVNPDTGNTSNTEVDQVTITVDRSSLAPGDYSGIVSVISGGQRGSVSVGMTVPSVPTLSLHPKTLDFDSIKISLSFNVLNSGKETLSWTVSDDQDWIMINPTSGTTTIEIDSVIVTVDRSGLSPGSHTGSVIASSNGGIDTVSVGMLVRTTNKPPQIQLSPLPPRMEGESIQVGAIITDDTEVASATLMYRKGGEVSFSDTVMTPTSDGYRGFIPAREVTSLGVEYYIEARDLEGAVKREPDPGIFSVQVIVSEPGVVKETPQPDGEEQTAYRLVSVPLELDNKSPNDVLQDDLGAYLGSDGKHEWRFFALQQDQSYVELTDPSFSSAMTPGKAFWLIVRESGKIIDTGPGTTIRTDKSFEIQLHPEWNFVATPFNFQIPIANVSLKSGNPLTVRKFTGPNWNDTLSDAVTQMLPFLGYAVHTPTVDTLLIDPELSATFETISQFINSDRKLCIHIIAQCQNARDVDNYAVVFSDALRNRDHRDQPEPLVIGEYVSVYFPNPEQRARLCIDARPAPVDGEIWEFEVKTNIRDRIQLTFDNLESVPSEFEVWLVDEALKISQNLRETNIYSVVGLTTPQAKRLKLVVGNRDFIQKNRIELNSVPAALELSQNFPNPFNPVTTIRYGLPQEEWLTLKVYNLLGKEVATLVDDERKKAGYHVVIWDGRNQEGQFVASGIYFYQLQTESLSMTKKMIYVQ